jgi:hypothetical protein
MQLIDAIQLCDMLCLSRERKRSDGPVPSGLKRVYRMAG